MPRAAFPSLRKLLPFIALAGAFGAWWWAAPPQEPIHDGVRLSEWLADFSDKEANQERGAQEIRAFGPSAIPWLTYKESEPLVFDGAPDWLSRLLPERLGGRRHSLPVDERIHAAIGLRLFGPDAAPAIDTLFDCLETQNGSLARSATEALHSIGPASWPAVQKALQRKDPQTRVKLLDYMPCRLGSLAKPAPEAEVARAVAALVKGCHDPDSRVRTSSAGAIADCTRLRPDSALVDSAIPEIILLLSDRHSDVVFHALIALSLCNAKAAPAIPRLIELMDDPRPRIKARAVWALARVDLVEKKSAPRMRAMLQDADPACRTGAADALEAFGLAPKRDSPSPEALQAR